MIRVIIFQNLGEKIVSQFYMNWKVGGVDKHVGIPLLGGGHEGKRRGVFEKTIETQLPGEGPSPWIRESILPVRPESSGGNEKKEI